jgi:elongation factor Ts
MSAVVSTTRRAVAAETSLGRRMTEGLILSYIHHNGKLGALVEVNCETDFLARTETFATLARHIAEHVAGAAPIAVDRHALPTEVVQRKRAEFEEQARAAGKPEALREKIVEGKMAAYFRDVALMNQPWVREPKLTVGDLVKQVSAETGETIHVRRFVRFHMGTA